MKIFALRLWHYFILGLALTSFVGVAHAGTWPRQIKTPLSTVTLAKPPTRIVSTSVTLTGSLLAIDAPVIATAAAVPNNRFSDQYGFFKQWGKIAHKRGVKPLYIGDVDAERVAQMHPDLIVVSASGKDSAIGMLAKLQKIAPTLVLDYSTNRWQKLVTILGQATGHESQAHARISEFAKRVQTLKSKLKLPPQPVNAFVYNAAIRSVSLWQPHSAQGQLLSSLGFKLAKPNGAIGKTNQRNDMVRVSGEHLFNALSGKTFLLFGVGNKAVSQLKQDQLLKMFPAAKANRVYALGADTFRLDYYSSNALLERLSQLFNKN
ncbi:Fe2+-enterobactin ABC transporter substrate-binding protein [Celerinatantimonas sp. MCCC 1A17872]|uniref:Fe2+-enterobactin ABC transporter substrate-binding protein n=1 Tax=Celerinatantimonas sp. MCCC 1A17872 TaxID=3177514 RepID=UPI0038C7B2BF